MLREKLTINRVKSLYWNKKYNVAETANKLGISVWSLYDFMRKNDISRRSFSQANYVANKNKPQFRKKDNLSISQQKLKIAGIMLYWAEGTTKGSTVDMVNSNPDMIKLFLKFLREICGVDERRLRVYLYSYSYDDTIEVKAYWHNITKISLNQFTKPYIREGNLNLSKRKLPYGLVHIRYNDKRLLNLIKSWIDEYINGEIAKRPNATDCLKKQRFVERRDGKVGEFREIPSFRDNPEPSLKF